MCDITLAFEEECKDAGRWTSEVLSRTILGGGGQVRRSRENHVGDSSVCSVTQSNFPSLCTNALLKFSAHQIFISHFQVEINLGGFSAASCFA
jgi:hypothetical protein